MRWLYHIRHRGAPVASPYAPAAFATEGFIHASFRPDVLESARRYFPAGAPLEVLQIDPRRVRYEVVVTERGPMPHITERIGDSAIAAILDLRAIAAAPDEI